MKATKTTLASTGIRGLDTVLRGGLPRDGIYLLEGSPGAGKTTLALQFLFAGREAGERCFYVTLSESRKELEAVARSHGWSLDRLSLFELPSPESRVPAASQTMLHPAELELEETVKPILDEVTRLHPDRVVIDSLSEIRLLANDSLRYRRQILSLKQFFQDQGATVILVDDRTVSGRDSLVASIANGVIAVDRVEAIYGAPRRSLSVQKLRGVGFAEGYHDFKIARGGISVFPRLVAADFRGSFRPAVVSSGLPDLDALVGGGLDAGTTILVQGPAGCGKSSLTMRYCWAAANRGEKAMIYSFDERPDTAIARAAALGMPLEKHLASGALELCYLDPAEMSPGEFADRVKRSVEEQGVQMVVIDSLNGYFYAMPEQAALMLHLHELFAYLGQKGTTSLFTLGHQGILGSLGSSFDVSYLADTMLLLRFYEWEGEIRQVLSAVKRRGGRHERTIRELRFGQEGIVVGPPLAEFGGVLTGTPVFHPKNPAPRP